MESIWSKTCEIPKCLPLDSDIETDVAVIGGGMAGILTAYQLECAGVRTVVLEAGRIGGGQTRNTTAKITSQHGMFCHDLIEKKGRDAAGQYVRANQTAVGEYKRIVEEERIDCDLEEKDSYVYSQDEKKLKDEAEAAAELGIEASFEPRIEIPVSCAGAVRFARQAQFHPLKFIRALAEKLTIYEDTPVKEVGEHLVKTPCGSVRAGKIVFATHYPFVNFPGMYFIRMHQERSYVLALENTEPINGMYIGDGKDTLSFRQFDRYLLFGGEGHRTGREQRRREIRRGKLCGTARSGGETLPAEQGGSLLVRPGLHYSRQRSLHRQIRIGPSGLVCRHRVPEVGHDFIHGICNDHQGYDLRN